MKKKMIAKERVREERERVEKARKKFESREELREKWKSNNKQLVAGLYFCVHTQYRQAIKECGTVKEYACR